MYALYHGILMFLAFGIFTTTSVFIALYKPKYFRKQWLDRHLQFQLVGFLLCILSFSIIFFSKKENHFNTVHSILGLILIIGTGIVQPHLGLPDDYESSEVKRESYRRHSLLGQISLASSYLNILLGMRLLDVPTVFIQLFLVWCIIVLFIFIRYKPKQKKQKRR